MENKFEDIFKQKFDGFEVNPPQEIFQKISANKAMQPQTALSRIPTQVWIASAVLITAVIITGILLYNPTQPISNNQPSETTVKENTKPENTAPIKETRPRQPIIKQTKPILATTNNNSATTPKTNTGFFLFAGNDTIICGNEFHLIVRTNLKSFRGQWICGNRNVKILSPKSKKTVARFSKKGTYQFIYSGFYNQSFMADTIAIMIMGLPPKNRFTDTAICGLDFQFPKVKNIKWIAFQNINQITEDKKVYRFKSKNYQTAQVIREATSGSCVFTDTVLFRFNQPTDFSDFSYQENDAFCHQRGKITTNFHGNYTCLLDGESVQNPKIIFAEPGNHTLTIQDENGCKKDFPITISKTGKILPDFSLFSLTNNAGMPIYFHNQTTVDAIDFGEYENIKFYWSFGDGKVSKEADPEHTFKKAKTYKITLTVVYNDECQEKFQKQIVIKPNSDLQYPNVFSPNGDGNNDIFFVKATDLVEFRGKIFSSKSGEEVFEWSDSTQGWNGKINGNDDAPEGIYYFVLKGKGKDGKIFVKKSNLY
ncbi:MAG: gliding motility-associated C-terminal domain-containing protein, partial [Bacteroidales bacterium]|nr:gliding motility-associated C-terminal domain-containing protein [Bacteroidales bacterium]